MGERFSTGFRNAVNATGDVKTIMANSVIGIFGGTQPTDADDTEGSSLLMLYTLASGAFTGGVSTNGLNMGVSTAGVLAKAVAEVWSGVGLAAAGATPGTVATWFRWYANAYDTGADPGETYVRVDGAIGTASSYELQMSNTSIVLSAPATITAFNFTFPAS